MMRRLAGRRRGDDGIALVTVLLAMCIITAILMTSLAYTLNNVQPARTDADGKAALAAAQAGIDDYLARLAANSNYWANGNSDASNLAFSTGRSLSTSGASFTYQVLNSDSSIRSTGTIKLKVTGKMRSPSNVVAQKSLFASVRVNGFLNYVYMSDLEVMDEELGGVTGCDDYYYATSAAGTKRRAGNCGDPVWGDGEVVAGPLHTNDALRISGDVDFRGKTESSWPAIEGMTSSQKTWWGTGASAGSLPGNVPQYAPAIPLPSSNASLLNYVRPNMTGNSSITTGPGCYYAGPTEIVFNGAQMSIRSPRTTASNTPLDCYNRSNASNWQTISPIPEVIYVGAPGTGSCSGTNAGITYPLSGSTSATTEAFTAGTPSAAAWERTAPSGGGDATVNYSCNRGTVYVKGQASTSVTVAAVDDVVISGDLTVPSLTGGAAIGLIGGNAVWVYHPVTSSNANVSGFDPANTINASILALNRSFQVENFRRGAYLGNLSVTGAIAQKHRGTVGTSGTNGYAKNYIYDTRLRTMQPPYFMQPTASRWGIVAVAAA